MPNPTRQWSRVRRFVQPAPLVAHRLAERSLDRAGVRGGDLDVGGRHLIDEQWAVRDRRPIRAAVERARHQPVDHRQRTDHDGRLAEALLEQQTLDQDAAYRAAGLEPPTRPATVPLAA
jgi:hypothetical protein